MMINAGALAAFLVLLSIAPGTGVAPDAVAPEPNAPVVLTVQIVDEAGVPLEERVMGLAAPEQAAGLFDDVAILSETRSVTDHGLDIRMTVQAGSSGIVE